MDKKKDNYECIEELLNKVKDDDTVEDDDKFKFIVLDYSYELVYSVKDFVLTITKLTKTKISNLHNDDGSIVDRAYIEKLIEDNFYDVARVDFDIDNI